MVGAAKKLTLPWTGNSVAISSGSKPCAFRHDGVGAHGDVGQAVTARAMRHRRCVQHAIAGAHRFDLGEVAERLLHQIAMGEHRALGAAGGAAGIKQPGQIVGRARRHVDTVALIKAAPLGAAGRDGAAVRCDVVGAVGACQNERSFGVADDVTELLAMELGVHRHRDQSGMPDRKQCFEKFRPVGHGDRHPGFRPAQGAQTAGQRARARRPLPVGRVCRAAERNRRTIRRSASPFLDPAREVHRAPRRGAGSGGGLGVDEHRREQARLAAAIDPRMIGAALDDAVSGMQLDLALFHEHMHRA